MNYYAVGIPAALVAVVLGLLLWLLYLQQNRLPLLPEQVRAWREREGLSQEQAAEVIGRFLGKRQTDGEERIDVRTLQRWEAGENLPHLMTYLKMQPLLNGKANYLQMQQTLDNGTQSYGAFVRRDEATPADIARLLYEPIERSYKKGLISEEDWKAHQERRAADYQAAAQRQPARKRGRPRKKHRSR